MAIKFNRSQTFATNGTVTAAALHNLIDGTDIYQALITDQTAMTSVGSLDKLLIADSDLTASDAPRSVTVNELFEDALTLSTYTNLNAVNLKYTSATGNYTLSTGATITNGTIANGTITNGVIPSGTFGTTTSTAETITRGTIQTLTASTATISEGSAIFTQGTIGTLNSTTGTISTLRSTTGTIANLSTTLAGDFTISQGTATLATSGATAGTYGSVTAIPFLTVDAKGRITSATTGTFSSTPADGSITPAKLAQPFTSGTAVASTSGTAIDFTGIPSWVKRITVMFSGVSTNGVSNMIIQIGDSGGIEATSYLAHGGVIQGTVVGSVEFTGGFGFSNDNSATSALSGLFTISNISGNTWVFSGSARQSTARIAFGAGEKTLSALLDRVRITTVNGTDTFDAGSVNIMYEG